MQGSVHRIGIGGYPSRACLDSGKNEKKVREFHRERTTGGGHAVDVLHDGEVPAAMQGACGSTTIWLCSTSCCRKNGPRPWRVLPPPFGLRRTPAGPFSFSRQKGETRRSSPPDFDAGRPDDYLVQTICICRTLSGGVRALLRRGNRKRIPVSRIADLEIDTATRTVQAGRPSSGN